MKKRAPYTPCKLYIDGADGLQAGDYITTSGGSAYLVQQVRQNGRRPERKHLQCLRWPAAEIPDDARCYQLTWYRR
ncbi:hypothetical protein [Metapseudomonas sp. CR1201]